MDVQVEVFVVPQTEMQEDRFARMPAGKGAGGEQPGPYDDGPGLAVVPDHQQQMSIALSTIGALGSPGYLGTQTEVEKELDLVAAAIRTFHAKPADLVMRETSAYTARLTELAVLLHRVEGQSRQWTRVRTQQVQRFLDECDRQWKTASRLIEVSRQDLAVMRGQV